MTTTPQKQQSEPYVINDTRYRILVKRIKDIRGDSYNAVAVSIMKMLQDENIIRVVKREKRRWL